MNSSLDILKGDVAKIYESKMPGRADWADWLYKNHVLIVADYSYKLANKYGADPELSVAAALLHDIADATMKRTDAHHEQASIEMGKDMMVRAGYTENEIKTVIDDAVRYHSCHDGEKPESLEGKILATADSFAHLKTDFYIFAANQLGKSLDELKEWTLKKIERDLHNKCFFEDERNELLPDYKMIKELFSR